MCKDANKDIKWISKYYRFTCGILFEVMDELTKHMQKTISEYVISMQYSFDWWDKTRSECQVRSWSESLELRHFKIIRDKCEYMKCHFSNHRRSSGVTVKIDGCEVDVSKSFKYLVSILQEDSGIDEEIFR